MTTVQFSLEMGSGHALASLIPGSLIAGRYTVQHALGKGGMGTVYAVRDLSTDRRLALKCLQREAARENGPAAALFQREYHTLAHLRHPRVIQVFDYGVDGGRPYYTMELLDGSDLRELAPVPWRRACELLRDVAFSLALLHSRRLLHRDLSPRNVRCTRDGRAKLLDFGTMAPMGTAKDVAGTPPYMAPEAVHGQVLDARTDLYALGALAYWTLTGYDAYPARDGRELQQFWPRPILPPSAIAEDVPEALDALVMSLLSLDPQARPSHVAEVIERLAAIAGLEPGDQLEMARAYLTSPTLIGRGETLASFHKRLVRAARGRGSALLIRGAPGMGRSRLLQALVLEAKLSGIQVLAAGTEDAQRGELGVARALIDALVLAAPDIALSTFRPHADVLGGMFPALYDQLEYPPAFAPSSDPSEQFARMLQALRDWIVLASQQRPLLVAVDDADHVDDGSAACLALLAGDTRAERLVVCAAVETEAGRKALELFAAEAARIELVPLNAGQTARLLRSVFGEVPHVQVVAEWIHALSQGHPRTVMELSQYLVDHGIARFERGSWTLPETLRDAALPESIEQALSELLAALTPPARALAQALALVTESGHLELDEIVRLTGFQSPEQTFGAVDELLAAQVIAASGTTHHVRHRGLSRALYEDLSAERRRLLHLRLANLYQTRAPRADTSHEQTLLVAYHRHLGGDIQGCLDALAGVRLPGAAAFGHTTEAASMYEACLARGVTIGLPPARLYPLRKALVALSVTGDPALIQYAQPTLAQLCQDCGLAYLDQQAAESDPVKRIRRCVARALKTYAETPEAQRGLPPIEALAELGEVALVLAESYVARNEAGPVAELAALIEPLCPLSPALALVHELTRHAHESVRGSNVALQRAQTLARLEQPLEGLDPGSQHTLRSVLTYWLAMDEAAFGKETALERAVVLEAQPRYAPLGAQVRSIYHLFAGNETEAEVWRKRRELLALQLPANAGINSTPGMIYEALGYYLCGSVLGMRRVLDTAGRLATRHAGWKPWLRAIEGLYALLRGEPGAALPLLQDSDAMGRILALLQLGHVGEARAVAEQAFEREPERSHPLFLLRVHAAAALALSAAGDPQRAARQLDEQIARAEADGIAGMLVCVMYEARARIAVDLDDRPAFRRNLRKLGTTYGRGTAGLRARYEQLGLAARRALISLPPLPPPPGAEEVVEFSSAVSSEIELLETREQRCARALRLLAEQARSSRGFLFGMQEGGLRLCASIGDGPPPEGIEDMLAFYLNAELDSTDAVPHSVTGMFAATPDMVAWINDGQHLYYPVLLSCVVGQRRVVSGVAALALPVQREPQLSAELLADISHALLAAGDVVGADAAR